MTSLSDDVGLKSPLEETLVNVDNTESVIAATSFELGRPVLPDFDVVVREEAQCNWYALEKITGAEGIGNRQNWRRSGRHGRRQQRGW